MEIIEREIGEIFEFESKKIEVKVASNDECDGCFFNTKCTSKIMKLSGECNGNWRIDGKNVIFVEVQPHKLNLCEILKNCPKGTKLYSTIFGEVEFLKVNNIHQIVVTIGDKYYYFSEQGVFLLKGIIYLDHHGECVLFPSKDQRDWSKFMAPWLKKKRFDPKTLKPFDRVMVRDDHNEAWFCTIFSHLQSEDCGYPYNTASGIYFCCIPYNDDTKHLVGTTDEAPEYYRYWEDYQKME